MALLLALSLPAQPPPPQAEVRVQAPELSLPDLPASVAEARRDWPRMKAILERRIRDAEEGLDGLRALPKAAGLVSVLPDQLAEAEALAGLLVDDRLFRLEQEVLDRWNAWQNHLLALAAREAGSGRAIARGMVFRSLAGAAPEDPGVADADPLRLRVVGEAREPRTLPSPARRRELIDVLGVERMDYRAWGRPFREAAAGVEPALRHLGEAWGPLGAQVQAEATRWLDLQRAGAHLATPGLRALRTRTQAHLLSRIRTALWLDLLVWAHVAGEPLPPALKPAW